MRTDKNRPWLIVPITKKHIEEGLKGDEHSCPIAKAVIEKLQANTRQVSIGGNGAYRIAGKSYESPNADTFVENFDQGDPVKPFNVKFRITQYQLERDQKQAELVEKERQQEMLAKMTKEIPVRRNRAGR